MGVGIFQVSAENMAAKLNLDDSPNGFTYGDGTPVTQEAIETIIRQFDETVAGRLPLRYANLLTEMPGEVLIDRAAGGERNFTTAFRPISGLLLFRNYRTETGRPWSDWRRADALPAGHYTANLTTGGIVLTPGAALEEDDTLWAKYSHTGAGALDLPRKIVENLVAGELGRRLGVPEDQFDRFTEWETQAYSDLKRMVESGDGRLTVYQIDRIRLVDETTPVKGENEEYDPLSVVI